MGPTKNLPEHISIAVTNLGSMMIKDKDTGDVAYYDLNTLERVGDNGLLIAGTWRNEAHRSDK